MGRPACVIGVAHPTPPLLLTSARSLCALEAEESLMGPHGSAFDFLPPLLDPYSCPLSTSAREEGRRGGAQQKHAASLWRASSI
jgi:hypothetical protein